MIGSEHVEGSKLNLSKFECYRNDISNMIVKNFLIAPIYNVAINNHHAIGTEGEIPQFLIDGNYQDGINDGIHGYTYHLID